MSERHLEVQETFFSPAADGTADGTSRRPYASFTDALSAISDPDQDPLSDDSSKSNGEPVHQSSSESSGPSMQSIEIVYIDSPGDVVQPAGNPSYRFFFDPQRVNRAGDGTELSPWPDLHSAAGDLEHRRRKGDLKLRDGDRVRITRREVFTATSLERTKKIKESIAKYTFMAMAFGLVLPVLATIGYLVYMAWPALSFDFVFENPKNNMSAGGIWAPLIGTFFLVILSLIIAAPIGVLAGVYLNEYASDNWVTRIINLAVVNLAGVPSIVHGLFGVGAFVALAHMGKSLLAASCTIAVMTLPVIIASTKEALASVPMSFRAACWNLGASRWQTIRTIVLPNSISGILTGVILQVSRAAGETAPILFTGVAVSRRVHDSGWESFFPFGLDDKFMALSNHLFILSKQNQGASDAMIYGTAVVLIGLVLLVNSLAIILRVYVRSRKKW